MPTWTWGTVTNTNGYNGWYSNPGVRTNGIQFPQARLASGNYRPIRILNINWGYATGPSAIDCGIIYGGTTIYSNYLLSTSGGVFTFFIRGTSGTLRFGRDEGASGTVVSENSGYTWNGRLVGNFTYAEVATAPTLGVSLSGNTFSFSGGSVSDNGGAAVTIWREVQINGGAWQGATSSWNTPYVGTPGSTYRFQTWARNSVGDSLVTQSGTYTVGVSGGRRATGSSTAVPLTIARRYSGTAWRDLTVRNIYRNGAWTQINN